MSVQTYLTKLLATHGWDSDSDGIESDTEFKDCMKASKPMSLLSTDAVKQLFSHVGPMLKRSVAEWPLSGHGCVKPFVWQQLGPTALGHPVDMLQVATDC